MERFLHSFRQPASLRLVGIRRGLASLKLLRPYTFHITLALYVPILLYADTRIQTLTQQHALGLLTFTFVFVATRFSPRTERRQVWLMVGIATCVELFLSLVWGLYQYRWGNVPLFVPPGHGLLYLFALRATRTPLMIFASGGGGFGIFNGPDEATLNRIMVQYPFFPYSLITVRPILDGDTALGQWREIMSEGMGAGPAV